MTSPSYRPPHPTPSDTFSRVGGESAFFPEASIERWVRSGEVVVAGGILHERTSGRRWALRDALRILGRRNGETDPYGLVGSVIALRDVLRRGATMTNDGIRLGPAVYDIEYGAIASAVPDEGLDVVPGSQAG